jgi:hypothetical protein
MLVGGGLLRTEFFRVYAVSLVYISISAVTAAYGFALTARHFWQTPQKYPKGLAPSVRPLAEARRSFAPVSIWGHRPTVCFATTYMRWVRLRRTALRANPQMNTSTQPPEGAGGSRSKARSKAAGELTLGLLSGEGRVHDDPLWERACSRRRPQRQRCLSISKNIRTFPHVFQVARRTLRL